MNGDHTHATMPSGTLFGTHKILRVVGQGATATVYEAVDLRLQKRVALKVLHPQSLARPVARARFEREARIAAQLKHPHLVEVFDLDVQDDSAWISMEYVQGGSLGTLLAARGRLTVTEVADIVIPVASALEVAHQAGVVHRDVKPDNVLLARHVTGAVHPKLADFGIAKVEVDGVELTRTSAVLGSPCYMSPEQVRQSRAVDGRTDQWALGVVMYEAVVGRRPFDGGALVDIMNQILAGQFHPPCALCPEVSPGFERVILRALQVDPDRRYGSMRQLAAELVPWASAAVQAQWGQFLQGPDDLDREEEDQATSVHDASTRLSLLPPPPPPAHTGTVSLAAGEVRGAPRSPRAAWPVLGVAITLALPLGAWIQRARSRDPRATGTIATAAPSASPTDDLYEVALRVQPADASIELDGVAVSRGAWSHRFARRDPPHRLRVSAPGYEPQTLWVSALAPTPPEIELQALAVTAVAEPAAVTAPEVDASPPTAHRHGARHHGGATQHDTHTPGGRRPTWF